MSHAVLGLSNIIERFSKQRSFLLPTLGEHMFEIRVVREVFSRKVM